MFKRFFLAVLLILGCAASKAQQTYLAAGGNAAGTGGSAAYAVAQSAYMFNNGSNGNEQQGVLQPYALQPAAPVFVFDKLGLTAATQPGAAYSLRLLSSSYTGPLLRLRIDTVFYDVYPDATASHAFSMSSPVSAAYATFDAAQTGATSTLLSTLAIGGKSAGVATWYDQSANARNAVQGNINALPQIIRTGSITMANNKPAITFSGSQWLTVTTTALNTNLSGSVVYNATGSNNTGGDGGSWYQMRGILGSEVAGTVNDYGYGIYNGRFTAGNGPTDMSVAGINVNDGITRLGSWTRQSSDGTVKLYSNQHTDMYAVLNTGELNSVSSLAIGATTTGGDGGFYGSLSEMVLSPLVYNDTERQAIESSQTTYYQIITQPTISVTNDLPALTVTTRGTASAASSFVVAGYQLTGGILVTAPDGFEVGKDNTTFAPAVTVGTGGDIASAPVYIRLSATAAAGNNLGNIILSSAGAATVKVAIAASTVLPQAGDGPTANYGTAHTFALDEPSTVTPLGANVGALGYNAPVAIGKSIGSGFVKAVVDSAGNTYLISSSKTTIQVIPANGAAAYDIGGPFNSPVGMALDKAGNLYVAERTALYKVVPATGTTTPVTDITLTSATSIAADDYGNLYIVNRRRIYKYEIGTGNFNEIDSRIAGVVNIAVKGNTVYYSVLISSQQAIFQMSLDGSNLSIVTQPDGFAVDGDLTGHAYGGGLTNISRYGGDDGLILNVGAAYNLSTDLKGNIYYAATQDSLVKKLTPSGGYFINKALPSGLALNGTTGIISGTPQAVSPAANYTITAYSGTQSVVSTVTLATVVNNRDLSALTVSGTTIGDSFNADTTGYNAVTAASLDMVTITPTAAAAGSTITCNGITVTSGSAIQVPLVTGANTIYVVVTSVFGTTKTYTLNIKRGVRVSLDYGPEQTFTVNKAITAITPAAANVLPWGYDNPRKKLRSDFMTGNYLAALTDSAGTTYVVWQNLHPDDLSRNYITAVPADGGATYNVGGPFNYISAAVMDKDGNLYVAIVGGEIYKVVPSTNTKTLLPFSITTAPQISSLALDDNGRLYIGDVHNGLYILDLSTGVTKKVDNVNTTFSIAIFENYLFYNDFGVMYRSDLDGVTNKIITGYPGSQFLVSFFDPAGYYYGGKRVVQKLGKGKDALNNVQAQPIKGFIRPKDTFGSPSTNINYDGTTLIDYSATIDGKGKILSGLAIGILLDIPSGGYYIDKRLPRGMDFDEYTGVISGTPTRSSPKTDYRITAYNEQENAVSTFTLGVENNLELSNLVTDAGSLTPTFNADSTSYSITVNSSTTSANITASLSDTTNRLTVNGVAATSGAATSIALNIGSNTILVVVTASDSTTKTYTVNIYRATNKLAGLTVSAGSLNPVFNPDTLNYNVTVPALATTVAVTPAATDAASTITYNSNPVTRGSAVTIPLTGNATSAVFLVTSPNADPVTYTIAFNRSTSPVVNYGTAHTFALDEPITPVTPSGANVGALGYNAPVAIGKSIGSGFVKAVVDSAGNTYLISSSKTTIQVIPASGAAAYDIGGPFNSPVGMALDKAGNLYVAERTALYKVVPATGTTTPVPDITLTSATSIAADDYGNLYIVNRRRIYKYEIGTGNFNEIDTRIAGVVNIAAKGNTLYYSVLLSSQQGLFRMSLDGSNRSILVQPDGFAVDGDLTGHAYGGGLTNISRYGGDDGLILNVGAAYNLSTDLKGNIYYAATQDSLVKKLTPSGGYFIDKPLPSGLALNGTTGIISGTPQAVSPAANYTITAYSGTQSVVSTVTLATVVNNRDLSALTVSGTTIGDSFNADTTGYNAVTAANLDSLTITPTAAAAGSTITCNGITVASGSAINVPVVTGANTIAVVVTSEFGTAKTYTLNIKRGVRVSLDYGPEQTFTVNKAITAITPAAANVLPWGYHNPRKKVRSDFLTGNYLTALTDSAGTTYVVWQNLHPDDLGMNYITVVPADGGATYRIGGPFHYISAAIMDKEGNLYIAIEGGEVYKIIPSTNTVTPLPFSITNPRLAALALDDNNRLYIGDAHNGLFILDQTTGITTKVDSTKSTNTIAIYDNYIFYNDFGEMYRSELNGNNKIDIKNQSSQQLISFFDPAGYYYGEKIFVRRLGKKQYALDPNHDQIIKGIIIVEDTFNLTLGSTFYDGTARIDNSASIDGKGRFLGGLAGGFIFLDVPSGGYFIDKRLPPGMDFDEDTGIISGTPTKSWPKTNYHITAYNERENAVSTFTLGVENNLELTNLVTDAGSLTPTFNADSTSYSITVNSSTTSANITATLSDTTNRLTVNGVAATSGAATSIALNAGDNNIPVVVMTPDSTTKTYVVNIHRISNDYKLHNLTASTGVLSPAFDADVTGYTVDLPNGTNSAKLTPTADAFATIKVNNVVTRTGFASQNLALNPGDNNVEVDVTAEDGTSRQIYTVNLRVATSSSVSLGGITLSAGTLNPAFSPLSTGYRVTVPIGTANISVLPVLTDARSSATVNGTAATSAVSVPLSNGLNLITVNVLADDGTTTNTYTITVNRLVPAPAATAVAAQVYTKGIAIAPLSAGLSNVGTPGYFALADTLTKALPTPTGIAINKAGDLFVADVTAGSVYKLPVGGGAPAVILNGLNNPLGVATDAGGNVYAIGLGSTGINKVTPAGVITTIGNSLVYPTALAVDTAGNIFVIETINHALKKVTPAGVTTTLTNDLTYPYGLTLNPAGDIYVADNNAGTIVKFDAAGGNKTELITGLTNPTDVKLDAQGNIYVNQGGSNLLTRFDKNGANPVNLSTGYEGLFGVAVGTDGKLYTTDNAKQAVEKLTPSGGYYLSDPLPNGLLFDAATGIISGTPTTLAAAKDYTITAYNSGGGTAQTINIAVLPNVSLANLTISEGTFTPAFDSTVGAYTATVANTTTSVTLTPTLSDASATVKVKGTLVSNGSASAPLSLAIGDNIIPVEVTGADGSTTKTYTVTVNRPGATVADLALISIDPASSLIVASKTKTQIGYTTSVSPLAATVSVTATLKDPNSTMTINGVAATSGLESAPVALNNSGVTFITTVVTAQDGVTTKTYTIAVSRTGSNISDLSLVRLSPASVLTVQSDTKALAEYSTSVSFATEEVSIIPTSKDPNATIKVNGITVANGATSPAIRLNAGATLITTVVTAEDGTTARTYKITVNRTGASVADLAILSMDPGSNLIPDIKSKTLITYGTSVGTNVTTVRFTPTLKDPNATITVNGVPAVSGVLSAPVALNTSGPTLVNIVVTAQDGTTTKTYAVTVNRTGGNLADLSQISTEPAYPLTVVSNSKTLTEYSIAVGMSLNSIKVLPTARDANASITVNGVPVASGAASAPVALNGVSTVITTVVTSGDGLNSKTYTLTVNRTGASVADLALLSLNPATVLAVQNNTKTLVEYSASVSLSTASLRVVPTAKDPNATIRVNGIVVASGTPSAAITLNPVTTVINTIVTAEDGVTTRTYRVTVTRVPAANADLAKVSLSAGTALQLQTNTPELVTYTTAVNAATASLTVKPTLKDTNATMTLNGLALANAAVSAPIALNTGNNTISIVVTAEDGSTTKTYNIIVNRPGNNLAVGRSDAKMFAAKSTNSFAPDEDAIVVHQGVSPNGDGFNDTLVIEGISSFTGNKLSIMNTNGTLVFEMKDYGKDGSHVFDGHTQNGTLLKPGTYYYLLEYQNGQIAKRRSGYIVLKF